jgi:ACDE family multidrug resistance protein
VHDSSRPATPRAGGDDTTLLMLVSLALSTLGVGASLPVIPLFAATLTEATTIVGVVVAMRWIARLVVNVPAAVACERWGAGRVFRWGSVAMVASGVSSALAPSWEVLLLARVIEGVAAAMTITAAMTVIAQRGDGSRRGRDFGHLQTAQRVGYWLGPVIGGTVAAAAGFRAGLWVYTAIALVALLVALPLRAGCTPAARQRLSLRRDARVVLAKPQFVLVGLVTFVVFFTMTGAQFTAVPFFVESVLDMGPAVVGWSLFAANAVAFVLIYPSGYASDRFGRQYVILVLLAISAVGLFWLPAVDTVTELMAASVVLGAGNTLRGPATSAYLVEAVGDAPMGVALGLFRSAGDIGSALGPVAAGWLIGFGQGHFFVVNGALTLAVLTAFAIGTRRRPALLAAPPGAAP